MTGYGKQWLWCLTVENKKGQRVQTGQRLTKDTALEDARVAMKDEGVELVILQRMDERAGNGG